MIVTNPVRPERPDPRVYREAKALISQGHQVTVLAWDRKREYAPSEMLEGIQIIRISTLASYGSGAGLVLPLIKFRRHVRRLLNDLNWDVLHCPDMDALFVGFLSVRRAKQPIIFDSHESYPDFVAPRVPRFVVWLLTHLERFLVLRVSAVISVGEVMADKYRGLGAGKVVVVGSWHNPHDMQLTDERRSELRAELGIDGLMVTYIGGFGINRALLELIEAVLQTEGVTLVLAGAGELRARAEALSKGCSWIKDLGVVPYQEALEIKSASDVVYRVTKTKQTPNSKYSAPNNLFEAIAAGVAVIGSCNGDLGKILLEEDCGVVLEEVSAQCVARALETLKNQDVLCEMRKNALRAAQQTYNWDEAKGRLIALYRELQHE